MAEIYHNFIFFEEECLTNPDGIFYVYNYRVDYPIGLSSDGRADLQLYTNWEEDTFEDIIQNLIRIRVLSLKTGVKIEDIRGKLEFSSVYLNGNLSEFCEIDLKGLKRKCEEIKISDFELTSEYFTVDELIVFLPEFLLDFGETLGEKQALCHINGMGILNTSYSNHEDPNEILTELCSAYAVIENLNYVLDIFGSPRLEKSVEEHVGNTITKSLNTLIESYTLKESAYYGVDSFKSMLKKYFNGLPENNVEEINELFNAGVFEDQDVFCEFIFEIKLFNGKSIGNKNDFLNIFIQNFPGLGCLAGTPTANVENVGWEYREGRGLNRDMYIQSYGSQTYRLIINVTPTFGVFM